jgi:hypothetical protein
MIRRLRDRHRWLVPLVAFTTALLFARAFVAYRVAQRESLAPEWRSAAAPRP